MTFSREVRHGGYGILYTQNEVSYFWFDGDGDRASFAGVEYRKLFLAHATLGS